MGVSQGGGQQFRVCFPFSPRCRFFFSLGVFSWNCGRGSRLFFGVNDGFACKFIRSLLDPVLRHNLGYFNHLFKSGSGTRTCALIVTKCVLAGRSGTSVVCSTLGACCWERSCDTILGISIITSIICGTKASGRLQNAVLAGRTGGTSKIRTTHETRGWILSLGPGHRNHFNRFQHCDVESLPNCPLVKCSRGREIRHFDDLHSRLWRAAENGLERQSEVSR